MKKRIIVGISIAILLCSVALCVAVQRKSSFVEGVVIEKKWAVLNTRNRYTRRNNLLLARKIWLFSYIAGR